MPPAHWTKLRKICAAVNKEKSCGRVSRSPKNAIFMWQRQRHEKAVILYRFFHPAEFLLYFLSPPKNEKQNYALQTVPGQQAQKSLKNPENGCFLTKTTVFHWSEWRDSNSRHPGPKGRRNIFSDSSRPFPILSAPMSPAFPTSYLHCFQVLRAGLWSDMWSNAAFRPTAAILAAAASGGLSLSTGIVAQENRLCNWFLLVQCLQDLVHWKQRIHSPFQSCAA